MKSNKYILFFTFLFLVVNASAQTKLSMSGKITDAKTGDPLAGASLYFPDLRIGGAADDKGVYKIQNIPQGKYLLEITYLGYSSIVETVEVTGDMQKDVSLTPSYI